MSRPPGRDTSRPGPGGAGRRVTDGPNPAVHGRLRDRLLHGRVGTLVAGLLGLLLWAAAAAAEPESRDPRAHFFTQTFGDLPEELEAARASGKVGLLLFFEQEGCPYCERMMKTVLNQAAVQDWYQDRFLSIAVDINGDVELTDFDGVTLPSKVFAAHRRVITTPTLSFIDLQGSEVHRRTAMVNTPEEFLRVGRYVAEGHYTDTPWSEFEAARAEHAESYATLPKVTDFRREGAETSARGQILLLAVTRAGCRYCAALRRDVLAPMSRNADEFRTLRIREMMMEPDTPVTDFSGSPTSSAALAERYGVDIAPTVLLLDGSGRLLSDPVIGYNNPETYGLILDRALAGALPDPASPSTAKEE